MTSIGNYLRAYLQRKHVRPWALSAPIIILLICLPLLRPLRHPLQSQMSDEEMAHWATACALVEQQTFAIDRTPFFATRQKMRLMDAWYSDQPPVLGLLLAGPYWVIRRCGYSFSSNPALVEYLLTLIAVTLPTAAAAGMLYRMARLFQLKRIWRATLALAVVLGSGMISYGTVLNPYAPAAALVLLAAAILVQVSLVHSPLRSGGYLCTAGLFAALAAAIDPAAIVFAVLFIGVIFAMRWRVSLRIGGFLMYGIGLIPPVLLHISLSVPITGDWRLGLSHLPAHHLMTLPSPKATTTAKPNDIDDDTVTIPPTLWQAAGDFLGRLFSAFLGDHGLLSHFPVLIFGIAGIASVMHRHWPGSTKSLAIATIAGASIIILRYVWLPIDFRYAMFGVRWYVVFLPLVLFWSGAWLRKSHPPAVWTFASVLLLFSVIVSLIGAMDPMPKAGYDRYTVAGVLRNLHGDTGR